MRLATTQKSSSADAMSPLAMGQDISPSSIPDEELVARSAKGERWAMTELYQRHVDAVFRRLTHLLGPDSEREDLIQHIFADVFRTIGSFRGEAKFSSFLGRVTTNVAYDRLKKRTREGYRQSDELLEHAVSPLPSPESIVFRKEQIKNVWSALDRLTPKKRIAFLLRVVEGLSLEEIAEQVRAKPPAVAQRIIHAQRELFDLLKREERTGHEGKK
jgi:RNA polymerase sigma-70 factor, ECF subfamily